MLSPHDVHAKGSAIISLGADMAKIQSSVAFEMATEPLQKAKQLQANRDLVSASQGKLANISGQERYLTCGSSHLTAFCRAVQAQCTTEDEQCRPCLDQTNQPVPPPARDPRPGSAAPVTPPKTPAVPQPAPGPMDPQPLRQPRRPHRPNWRPRETQGWQNRWLLLASCVTRGDMGGARRHIQQWRGHCPYLDRHLQAVQENGWDWEFNPP